MALSSDEIKNNLVNQILLNFPTALLDTGSVLRDVMIDPQSVELSNLSQQIDTISYLSTFIINADNISEEQLDNIGANWNVSRNNGNYAIGSVTFQTATKPTENITIGNAGGSGGISVKTLSTENGNTYEFVTTATVVMTTDATFNEESNCYEVTAPIRSVNPGIIYNIGIGSIRVVNTPIANITGCYNYIPTSGGTDRQSNSEYAISIRDTILGASKNIESGIDNILKNIEGVLEVKTLHPNSTIEPTQAGYAISYVKGYKEVSVEQKINYSSTITKYKLNNSPVLRIVSVNAIIQGESKTLVNGTDYALAYDEGIYYNTIYGSNYIEFLGKNRPDNNTEVIVHYAYNSLIGDCQNALDEQLTNYLVLGEILAAQAMPEIINISTNIKLKYNYNNETIKTEILTGLSNFILGLNLGQDITQEDIFTYLTTTFSEYISSITFPLLEFCKASDGITTSALYFTYGQYASLDENSIKINFD